MDPSEWMRRFKLTHEQAKAKKLNENDTNAYMKMREELARSLVAAQQLKIPDGEMARKHFRVNQMFKLEIANTYSTLTKWVSCKGFQANLQNQLKVGGECDFVIHVKRDLDSVFGKAKVTAATKTGAWLITFDIVHLSDVAAERLEVALFDAVLARVA